MASGSEFELRVKCLIESELNRGELGLDPQLARVHLHRAYWSQARHSSICVDFAIEVRRRNAQEPCLVWVWECKDYKGRVPVDDVEEFHSKLEQIGMHKGTIACVNGFQEGAVRLAESWHIGLVRILPDESVTRLVEAFALPTRGSVLYGLVQHETETLTTMFYGLTTKGEPTTDARELVALELKPEATT